MNWESLKSALDENHVFPGPYTFKFIVPKGQTAPVLALLTDLESSEVKVRESKNGTYESLTLITHMTSTDRVLEIYEAATKIPKLIAL